MNQIFFANWTHVILIQILKQIALYMISLDIGTKTTLEISRQTHTFVYFLGRYHCQVETAQFIRNLLEMSDSWRTHSLFNESCSVNIIDFLSDSSLVIESLELYFLNIIYSSLRSSSMLKVKHYNNTHTNAKINAS